MERLWTVSMEWYWWVLAVVVSLVVWEKWLEVFWYKFQHWIEDRPHNPKK